MKKNVFFCGLILFSVCLQAQDNYDFYISNSGNNSYSGKSETSPLKNIAAASASIKNVGAANGTIKIGFNGGDVFNETLAPGFPIIAGSYFENQQKKNFAILNGTNVFDTGWKRTDNTANIYEQEIPLSGFTGYGINGIGEYSYVYIFEIDKILEISAPFTARKVLKFVKSIQEADSSPGSFYEPVTTDGNPKKIYIHTSDGRSPNMNSRVRYEVTVRDRAINSTYFENNRFENLWITGYGAGNGMIAAGAGSYFNRMIFGPGAGIHHLGLRGATINNSLFLPSAKNTNAYAVVFYDVEGFGRHNKISNSIFLDIKYPVYTHTSYGLNFGALELDNVIAFADTTEVESFLETANNDTVLLNNVYTSRYKRAYNYGQAKFVAIKNSNFIDIINGISFSNRNTLANINNCYFKISGNYRAGGIIISDSAKLLLSNSIFHFKAEDIPGAKKNAGYFVAGSGGKNNYIEATGNIFIADTDPSDYVIAATVATDKGIATSIDRWQNNVYILLRGDHFEWQVTNRNTNGGKKDLQSFELWKQQSGQDKNSLFFDLRKDPRGLKAIFVDPENGDYSLANTFEGNQVKDLRSGMVNPISCFLKKPTYEEAAKIIMNNGVLTANACRNPCVQNSIRINHQFEGTVSGKREVQLQWEIEDEQSIDHYELVRSFGSSDFINIGNVPVKGTGKYYFIDKNIIPGIEYWYSLILVTLTGNKCYSAIKTAKAEDGKKIAVYPNPSSGKIMLSLNDYSGALKIAILNSLGIVVYSKEVNNVYGVAPLIDLSKLSKGIYWIKVQTTNDMLVHSFILK